MRSGYQPSEPGPDNPQPPKGPAAVTPAKVVGWMVPGPHEPGTIVIQPGNTMHVVDASGEQRPITLCGTTPKPGETVWRGDHPYRVEPDGSIKPIPHPSHPDPFRKPAPRRSLIERLWCPACLRLRLSPGHLLVCSERRARVIERSRHR